MSDKFSTYKSNEELQHELDELRIQLAESNDTLEAIRTGQVDALVVQGNDGHQLYTLKTADQTYRVFIEKMTEGAVTLNEDGIILYCNSQFASIIQANLSNVIGMPFENFIVSANREYYQKLLVQCWQNECRGEVYVTSGSDEVPVKLSLAALELEDGKSLSIIVTDLTAQKDIQQQLSDNNAKLENAIRELESSNHDLQQFAFVASHDLQEPLRKIETYSNILLYDQDKSGRDASWYLNKILNSAGRMRRLIFDILNYSSLAIEDSVLENVDLKEVVNELLNDLELLIEAKNAEIKIDSLPTIMVNRGQISQVFQNFISNALKFSKPSNAPKILITSKRITDRSFDSSEKKHGAYCMISIEDNGIGFAEDQAENIFNLFGRLHSKDKFEGTGIGLAIVKKIIEKHNGIVRAVSNGGTGTTFSFILPISNNNAP